MTNTSIKLPPALNIMLDIETLGTRPGCKILTISAVTFGTQHRNSFDIAIRADTQDLLTIDSKTLDWWKDQSVDAQRAAFDNPAAMTLVKGLSCFSDWIGSLNCTPKIWCKGAGFDVPILEAAYEAYKISVPWHFGNIRCYRTLEAEFKDLIKLPEFVGTKHTSLADARHQALCAEIILDKLWS